MMDTFKQKSGQNLAFRALRCSNVECGVETLETLRGAPSIGRPHCRDPRPLGGPRLSLQ